MALKHSFEVSGKSIVFNESLSIDKGEVTTKTNPLYVRVESINATKKVVRCRVMFYDKDGTELVSVKSYSFPPSMDGRNFIAQSYEYLKTLPEFAGATDC
jgi:hypothetical protein